MPGRLFEKVEGGGGLASWRVTEPLRDMCTRVALGGQRGIRKWEVSLGDKNPAEVLETLGSAVFPESQNVMWVEEGECCICFSCCVMFEASLTGVNIIPRA